LSQNDTTVIIGVIVAKGSTIRAADVEIEVGEFEVIFKAHPYFFKIRFNEPLVEGGPNFKFDVKEDLYLVSVGKLNYK
jgi:hypothetical protein